MKAVPKKKAPEKLTTITTRLDRLVSKIVRRRDPACVTCNSLDSPQAGHFESRAHYATRWDLTNVHRQCATCNLYLKGNPVAYYQFIQRTYGENYPNTLHERARGVAPNRLERLALEGTLKAELRRLDGNLV